MTDMSSNPWGVTPCATPHAPGECIVCDWSYRVEGQRKVARRCIERAIALAPYSVGDVCSLLKEALVYLGES